MVTIEKIKQLREKTGAGMMDCKKALVKTEGDLEKAVDLLREKGLAKAQSKASRVAAEGLCNAVVEKNDALVYEVNVETDFVSKNENFTDLVEKIGQAIFKSDAKNTEQALKAKNAEGETVEQMMINFTAKMGEKVTLRRVTRLTKKDDEIFGLYKHQGGRILSLVVVKGGDEEVARNLAMHVAASNPKFLTRESVDKETVDHEKEVLTQQAKNEGKPDHIVEKMVIGRLNKFFEQICFVDQPYVKDPDIKVKKYLKAEKAEISNYIRLEVGEGIEKREDDFAAEVAAQMK